MSIIVPEAMDKVDQISPTSGLNSNIYNAHNFLQYIFDCPRFHK